MSRSTAAKVPTTSLYPNLLKVQNDNQRKCGMGLEGVEIQPAYRKQDSACRKQANE